MRRSWMLAALGLVVAACGGSEPDRFDLRTPGARTGEPLAATPAATPSPAPTASATPERKKLVTSIEKRVIKGWSDSLRDGRVEAAARYFDVPCYVSNDATGYTELGSQAAIEAFNRGLTCGAKLLRTRRGADHFVVGIFRLTERKTDGDSCGTGIGETAAVAFEIEDEHITRWVRVAVDDPAPGATPTPAPTAAGTPTTS